MALFKNSFRLGRTRPNRCATPARRRLPQFESLEGRALLTLGFTSALGFGVSGGTFLPGPVVVDSAGDTFVTGGFTGQANFDPKQGPSGVLDAGTLQSAFVAKYSPAHALVWVKEFAADPGASGSQCGGDALAVDNNTGAIYVAGNFSGTVDFDPGNSLEMPVSSMGSTNAFIAELAPDGNLVSGGVRTVDDSGFDTATTLKLSPDGASLYVSGSFSGTANFDPGGANAVLSDPFPGQTVDGYVMKLTSSLGFCYVQGLNQLNSDIADLNVDATGNVYVVGQVPEANGDDAFFAKLDRNGNLVTSRDFGGPTSGGAKASATGVVVDNAGDIFITGSFNDVAVNFAATFGGGTVTLDSAGGSDGFLIALDSSFDLIWARRFGSTGDDESNGLTIDGNNNLYLPGTESGPSSFGTGLLGTPLLVSNAGQQSAFVLELNSSGNLISAVGAGGTGMSMGTGIAVNSSSQVAIDGFYSPGATLGSTSLANVGTEQFFLATLTNSSTPTPTPTHARTHTPTPTHTSTPTLPPRFTGEHHLTEGKGPKKKISGFELNFSSALDAGAAANVGHYLVTQPDRTKAADRKVVPVLSATPGTGGTSVVLVLGKYTTTKPLSLTASGLVGAGGTPVAAIVARL